MYKFTRRALFRRLLCLLLANTLIRKLLLASGSIQICYDMNFPGEKGTTIKAFLESAGLQLAGRSEFADKSLNNHYVIDAINKDEYWFWLTVDDYLFHEECVDHYLIYPGQQLTVYCL